MQKPSSLPVAVGSLEGYAPGEIVCSSVGEFVVIGRDTHTSVGGCADMLMWCDLWRGREMLCIGGGW